MIFQAHDTCSSQLPASDLQRPQAPSLARHSPGAAGPVQGLQAPVGKGSCALSCFPTHTFCFFCFSFGLPSVFHLDQLSERADDAKSVLCSLFRRDMGNLLLRMGNGIVNSPSLPSGSVPVVSPFKYVIVLGLSI